MRFWGPLALTVVREGLAYGVQSWMRARAARGSGIEARAGEPAFVGAVNRERPEEKKGERTVVRSAVVARREDARAAELSAARRAVADMDSRALARWGGVNGAIGAIADLESRGKDGRGAESGRPTWGQSDREGAKLRPVGREGGREKGRDSRSVGGWER